jgi:hypothetical protein
MRSRVWVFVFSLLVLATYPQIVRAASVILPAGTAVSVRTTQPIDADRAHVGMMVDALVDDPIDLNGQVIVPRGAHAVLEVVRVEESSNLKGRDRIALKLHSLRVGAHTYPVAANHVEFKGPSEGKRARNKILGGAGVGALVGGLLGGGTGVAVGATTGGATGAIVAGSGKTHLSVPAETVLQFRLGGALRVQGSR